VCHCRVEFRGLGFNPTLFATNRRVETRPTLFIVGWTLVQQDPPPTIGVKPHLHLDGNLTPIDIKSTHHYYKDVINELQRSP
jgi:hypothetical protein